MRADVCTSILNVLIILTVIVSFFFFVFFYLHFHTWTKNIKPQIDDEIVAATRISHEMEKKQSTAINEINLKLKG